MIFLQFAHNISNAAISSFLRFFKFFIRTLGIAFQCESLVHAADQIPVSLDRVHNVLGVNANTFEKYVVCPKCHSVYDYDDCVIRRSYGGSISKLCQHIAYPNHPQLFRRTPCDTLLLKTVKTKQITLHPFKVYPYRSVKASIACLVSCPGFLEECEKWRSHSKVPPSFLGDIYDGAVWNNCFSSTEMNFLDSPFCYLLTLNVDWFQPFERDVYALGAIYLTIQNLPRRIRYKPENIILVGIMPGPTEASCNTNSYLGPLVLELQQAWNTGFVVVSSQNIPLTVRLALSCIACDIPASRKVSGFLSHNASLGCHKCFKKFDVRFGQPSDFSGYDRDNWPLRTGQHHRHLVQEVLKETTKTGISAAESKHGVRYSALLSLPYFDPVRFTAIDIMHNLFLGTGKHMFELWIERGTLSKSDITEIERRISLFKVPAGVGRLPGRIGSRYGGFTADQWKNWILLYSATVLKGLLPSSDMGCWLLFVRACTLLCKPVLKLDDINAADLFFLQFCRRFENIYGKECCMPNMHLHLHLKQSFLDYGPPHAFWCYAFERYNGILGSYHTNKKSVESQFMKKFLTNQATCGLFLSDTNNPLQEYFPMKSVEEGDFNNLTDVCNNSIEVQNIVDFSTKPLGNIESFAHNATIQLVPPSFESYFDLIQFQHLTSAISQLYPNKCIVHLPHNYQRFGKVKLGGSLIGSALPGGNSKTSSVIMAYWAGSGDNLYDFDYNRMRVGVVQFFALHKAILQDESSNVAVEHLFAYVLWKKVHPFCDYLGVSSTVSSDLFETSSVCNFLPVQRIDSLAAHALIPIDFGTIKETVFVCSPHPVHYYL